MKHQINIGKIVRQQLYDEGRTVSWLCKKLNWQRKKMYRFFDSGKILVGDLHKISLIIHHDLFKYFSKDINNNK